MLFNEVDARLCLELLLEARLLRGMARWFLEQRNQKREVEYYDLDICCLIIFISFCVVKRISVKKKNDFDFERVLVKKRAG